MSTHDSEHLCRSIELAAQSGAAGNRPFGSVIVSTAGVVIGEGRNEVASAGDISAHAELVAIRDALSRGHTDALAGSVVYASGEPCPMCAAACVWAGVARIVFAASTAAFSEILPEGPHFRLSCREVVAASDSEIAVHGPMDESGALAAMRAALP